MRALLITTLALIGTNAAAKTFRCKGTTADTRDRIIVSGEFEGDDSGGRYEMVGSLNVSGTDGDGNPFASTGGGTSRNFSDYAVNISSRNGVFIVKAEEDNGSRLFIRHYEQDSSGSRMIIRLKPTRTMGYYEHEFENAVCTFSR